MLNIVRRTVTTLLVILVLLLIALWGLTPLIAQTVLKNFFNQHEAEFVAKSIWVNPFTATVGAENIEVTSQQGREFKFDDFQIELDILPIFESKVQVAQIVLNGLHLEVEQLNDGWKVAGVMLTPDTKPSTTEPETTDPETNASETPWEVHLPSVLLTDSTLNIKQLDPDTSKPFNDQIRINRLFVSRLTGKNPDWRGAATLSAAINGATADLATEFRYLNGNFTQWLDIQLMTASLSQFKHYLPAQLKQSNLNLSVIGEIVATQKESGMVLTASAKRFELDRVSLPLELFSLESERTEATINTFQVALVEGAAPLLLFEGEINSSQTRITTDEDRKVVATWDNLSAGPVSMRLENNSPDISIAKLEIDKLTASQNSTTDTERPPLSTINVMTVDDILITDQQTKIDVIDITDLNLQIQLDQDRKLSTLVNFPENKKPTATDSISEGSPQSASASQTDITETKQPYTVILNRLLVTGNSAVDFLDQGVSPSFSQRIDINSLSVEGLNTGNPEQAMHVVLEGKTDKYSVLKTDTRMWPFKEKLTVNTRTEIQEINLNPVSPYLTEALGYAIESGQLDMNITMNIDQGLMDGQTKINLRKFDLGGTDGPENSGQPSSVTDLNSAIPLNIAVGMLKDNSENIELDIPISGDVSSPNFGWGSFISLLFKNALFEATAGVIVQSFVPYANVLTIAKIAGDQLLKVRVEPLLYPPGAIDPATANSAFVDEFKNLMADKTDMQVTACPFASLQDLQGEKAKAGLSAQQREQLMVLAESRGEAFKDAIVADGKVKSSRILLCKPKLDVDETAQGRIEFAI